MGKPKTKATKTEQETSLPAKPTRSLLGPLLALVLGALLIGGGFVFADWWSCLPDEEIQPHYVGRQSCVECHATQHKEWSGSHHDLAMDLATDDKVLGNFENAELEHYGITSRMFRRDDKYMVHTEGPTGEMEDFEIKYVFGVEPLQQYLVEFDRPKDMPAKDIARLQVLRLCWDTNKKSWFYLSPPNVDEKLEPTDRLHWTGVDANWNKMCADCHSTNLEKNFDLATNAYHMTYSELDVSCEACHGPGSTHVKLANANSMFWDRKHGYGLPDLDAEDPTAQLQSCAPCHARRRKIHAGFHPGDNYFDHYDLSLLGPQTYHADGQILDEVYVYGSFAQSKMFHKGIRCSDCHNSHTTKVKFDDNRLCTSCHEHSAGKYDVPSHHHHKLGSEGARCVQCHMPETTYMEVDPRRDHSIRKPRPDLSVELGTPNACTGCHLERSKLPKEKADSFKDYAHRLLAARQGDQDVKDDLHQIDLWAMEKTEAWFGKNNDRSPHFATAFSPHWSGELGAVKEIDEDAEKRLVKVVSNRNYSAQARASALRQLRDIGSWKRQDNGQPMGMRATLRKATLQSLDDPSPLVRAAAVGNLDGLRDEALTTPNNIKPILPLMDDPVRWVRIETGRALSRVPQAGIPDAPQRVRRREVIQEYIDSLMVDNDRAPSHFSLGVLYERMLQNDFANSEVVHKIIDSYETAIRLEGDFFPPHTNLANFFTRYADHHEQLARQAGQERKPQLVRIYVDEVARYRKYAAEAHKKALPLIARGARQTPENAAVQFEYGMALVRDQQREEAEKYLKLAVELAPDESHYRYVLTIYHKDYERWEEARASADLLVKQWPDDPRFGLICAELQMQHASKLIEDGKTEEAEAALVRAAESAPPHAAMFRYRLALYYKNQKRWDKASEVIKMLVKDWPNEAAFQELQRQIEAER